MAIFVARCPTHVHQLLLLFGLHLLENVWGLLFPAINSWFLRAFYSLTLAKPSFKPFSPSGRGNGAREFWMNQFSSLFIYVELKPNASYWPQGYLSLKRISFFF